MVFSLTFLFVTAHTCPQGWVTVGKSCIHISKSGNLTYFAASQACAANPQQGFLYDPYLPIFGNKADLSEFLKILSSMTINVTSFWISGIRNEGFKMDVFSCVPSFNPVDANEIEGKSGKSSKAEKKFPTCLAMQKLKTVGGIEHPTALARNCQDKLDFLICQTHLSDWYLDNFDTFCEASPTVSHEATFKDTEIKVASGHKKAIIESNQMYAPFWLAEQESKKAAKLPTSALNSQSLNNLSASICIQSQMVESLASSQWLMLVLIMVLLAVSLPSFVTTLCILCFVLKNGEVTIRRTGLTEMFTFREQQTNMQIVC